MKNSEKWLLRNKEYHNRIAKDYQKKHPEIYNPIEQKRLRDQLSQVVKNLLTNNEQVYALDVGAGAGNVTNHLLDLGCRVVSADVSESFLEELEYRFLHHEASLDVALLNGQDLSNWASNTFDLCTTYSVLHHVPDYLSLVNEMARVIKPGGIIFIDHESSPQSWNPPPKGIEYLRRFRELRKPTLWQRWRPSSLMNRLIWKWNTFKDPRYQEEGDIHIWPDDHIEWTKIKNCLTEAGFIDVKRQDYLVCREINEEAPLYFEYINYYQDMSLMTGYKNNSI